MLTLLITLEKVELEARTQRVILMKRHKTRGRQKEIHEKELRKDKVEIVVHAPAFVYRQVMKRGSDPHQAHSSQRGRTSSRWLTREKHLGAVLLGEDGNLSSQFPSLLWEIYSMRVIFSHTEFCYLTFY